MSEVKRYSFWPQIVHLPGGGGVRAEVHFKVEEDGLFVAHQDYARLKAEVEAYRSASDEVAAAFLALPTPHNQVARVCEGIESLKADVERLRKAGDAMAFWLSEDVGFYWEPDTAVKDWNAAKEGKQP